MNWLVYERLTGVVVSWIKNDDKPIVMDHHDICKYDDAAIPDYSTVRIVDGVCVAAPDAVQIVRDRAIRRVNAKRTAIQNGGCTTAKGVMQSDDGSRLLLSGAIQMAQIALSQGQPFAMGWTMTSNQTLEHDAMELIAAGMKMGEHIAQSHATAVALKAAINTAERVVDIEAIDIEGAPWTG